MLGICKGWCSFGVQLESINIHTQQGVCVLHILLCSVFVTVALVCRPQSVQNEFVELFCTGLKLHLLQYLCLVCYLNLIVVFIHIPVDWCVW